MCHSIDEKLSSSSRATSSIRYNYTCSLTRIIFIARVSVKMAATRKAIEEFSPISPQRRECGTFPTYFFLEMIHISLKEGWFICRGYECRCELFIYFPKIFALGSVSSLTILTLASRTFRKTVSALARETSRYTNSSFSRKNCALALLALLVPDVHYTV